MVGAVEGGGAGCGRGMVLVPRRACAGALVVVRIAGGGVGGVGAGIGGEVRRLGG